MLSDILDKLSPKLVSCIRVDVPNTSEYDSYGKRIVQHYELEYICSGSGYILVNGIPVPVVPGNLNYRFPGMCVEGIGMYSCIFIRFDLNEEAAIYKELEGLPIVYRNMDAQFLSDLFDGFCSCDSRPLYSRKLFFKSQFFSLLNEMLLEDAGGSDTIYCVHDRGSDAIKKAIEYLQLNYDKPLTLEELAARSGYSIYHFCRFFKQLTGWTPIQYLTHYRINKSILMLRETSKTMEDIYLDCGFNSYSYFFRTFKSIYGISPKAYRAGV